MRPATTRAVTFGRGHGTVIPAGREAVSDAVRLPVTALDKLSVTLYVKGATDPATFHDIASATTFRARGVRVIGGTIMPFKGNPWLYPADNAQTLAMEKTRDAVSQWIRDGGEYDAVEPPALKLPVAGNF
ncbi:hypothetical protein DMB42_14160 [Nonomuraea sp. WAC 01424]|uniref:hypothetical protein n=1 Tax=Nonomuraea sp. WAC 01424 TaxID=2203200 RepID=UPI000F7A5393|nr:hypothetical protein [Nonomuraea sp. WAC 01424]RSN11708.1 hypothetical protein DMB42_14160 [Nonomuraea sp. WAC 01424]